jgi:hypothetical protein
MSNLSHVELSCGVTDLLSLAEAMQAASHARSVAFTKLAQVAVDPSWDILLFLFIALARGERATVVQVCNSTLAPKTTAIRHIQLCEQHGYVTRTADTIDRRRIFLSLAPSGVEAMRGYLEQIPLTSMRCGTLATSNGRK